MGQYQSVFRRREVKYLLSEQQFYDLLRVLDDYMVPDAFFQSDISNLYYDTPDFRLIRQSLAKPKYKEKLRLRCYGTATPDTQTFLEIKKKCAGVVYKRRTDLPYAQAVAYLGGEEPGEDSQIFQELDWFLQFYGELAPAMYLSYHRFSLQGREDPELRMTFDDDILWRTTHLDLQEGNWGTELLKPGQRLMEIKIQDAMPIWLAEALSELQIFSSSFSKYGAAYQTWLRESSKQEEVRRYA